MGASHAPFTTQAVRRDRRGLDATIRPKFREAMGLTCEAILSATKRMLFRGQDTTLSA